MTGVIITREDGYTNVDGEEWGEVWETTPPAVGVKYQVVEERWNEDYTTRVITRIRVLP